MEAKTQYALHESDSAPQLWAASVRLTPELLDKLRRHPEQVLLRLNVSSGADGVASSAGSGGVSASRSKSKKTSVLSVRMAADSSAEDDNEPSTEQYEMLSFAEDPRINHLCAFRRAPDAEGYNIHKAGAIHQKLLVQRLLDATEKGRIKDKHARSVLASKSRTSKLIDAELETPAKRPRVVRTRLSSARGSTKPSGGSAWSAAAEQKRKLRLPSALTETQAQETRERIEKGFELEVEAQPQQTQESTEAKSSAPVPEKPADAAHSLRSAKLASASIAGAAAHSSSFHELFLSDSDDEPREQAAAKAEPRVKKAARKKAAKEASTAKLQPKKAYKSLCLPSDEAASASVAPTSEMEMAAQPKESMEVLPDAATAAVGEKRSATSTTTSGMPVDLPDVAQPREAPLPPVKASVDDVEVKRPRVRSTLLPDGVRPSLLPDLSFFPPVVQEICKQLAEHRSRSVVLDEDDYDVFVQQHDQFRRDWEMLDKAYCIAMIQAEGLPLQLEFATDEDRAPLEKRLQACAKWKEGLAYVRTAMATIHKLLHGLQTSISHFDRKARHQAGGRAGLT